ncbi:MAG: hypothetical protein J6R98_01390 [Bacteroidaceae bacterium]|nr:hypothetical protein [Bacteroidaceae bacterium]
MEKQAYIGRMPAATGKGISCELNLNVSVADGDTTFLFMQTLLPDNVTKKEISDVVKGIQHHEVRMREGVEQQYLKLVPASGSMEYVFRVVNDSLLRMVRDDYMEYSDNQYYDFKRIF